MEYDGHKITFAKTATGYSAFVADLPGLGVAADSFEEVIHLAREAIYIHKYGIENFIPLPRVQINTPGIAFVVVGSMTTGYLDSAARPRFSGNAHAKVPQLA